MCEPCESARPLVGLYRQTGLVPLPSTTGHDRPNRPRARRRAQPTGRFARLVRPGTALAGSPSARGRLVVPLSGRERWQIRQRRLAPDRRDAGRSHGRRRPRVGARGLHGRTGAEMGVSRDGHVRKDQGDLYAAPRTGVAHVHVYRRSIVAYRPSPIAFPQACRTVN